MSALPKLTAPTPSSPSSSNSPLSESVDSSDSENYHYKATPNPQLPTILPPITNCTTARHYHKKNLIPIENQDSNNNNNSKSPKAPKKESCSFLPCIEPPPVPLIVSSNTGKTARPLINRNKCSMSMKKHKGINNSVVLPPLQDSMYSIVDKSNDNDSLPLNRPLVDFIENEHFPAQ